MKRKCGLLLAGLCAGAANGLFGGGGGMLLVPMLTKLSDFEERDIFPASLSIILPVCITSLTVTAFGQGIDWGSALPYLPGSALGGLLAGTLGKKIPVKWLHRVLGCLVLWGGVRYLYG